MRRNCLLMMTCLTHEIVQTKEKLSPVGKLIGCRNPYKEETNWSNSRRKCHQVGICFWLNFLQASLDPLRTYFFFFFGIRLRTYFPFILPIRYFLKPWSLIIEMSGSDHILNACCASALHGPRSEILISLREIYDCCNIWSKFRYDIEFKSYIYIFDDHFWKYLFYGNLNT